MSTDRLHLLVERPLRVLSLFAGIGAMDYGLELAGMEVIAQAEIDPLACEVLAERFPGVPNLGDVSTISWLVSHPIRPDVLAGGFPCQDNSSARTANERQGLDGPKSGLWREMFYAIYYTQPRWAIIENSPEWRRWVPRVREDLALIGYASTPLLLRAGTFGAPHPRPRAVVVAHANGESEPLRAIHAEVARIRPIPVGRGHWRQPFPGSVRVDDGTPARMDRLKAAGNAVVPAVFEWLGRQIIAQDASRRAAA